MDLLILEVIKESLHFQINIGQEDMNLSHILKKKYIVIKKFHQI